MTVQDYFIVSTITLIFTYVVVRYIVKELNKYHKALEVIKANVQVNYNKLYGQKLNKQAYSKDSN